jgi:Spy/CpxP family protein refolding chaperone
MLKRTLALAFSAAFAVATFVTAPADRAHAEMAAPAKESTKAKKDEPKKELTPQQQKMKDCAAKWKDEKKAKNVSGRKAYNEFMSKCLKG